MQEMQMQAMQQSSEEPAFASVGPGQGAGISGGGVPHHDTTSMSWMDGLG